MVAQFSSASAVPAPAWGVTTVLGMRSTLGVQKSVKNCLILPERSAASTASSSMMVSRE